MTGDGRGVREGKTSFGALRRDQDIRAVFRDGRARHCPVASVYVRPRSVTDGARATVVAGRKVGGSVVRNRAKRRLRSVLREITMTRDIDVVVVARPRAATDPYPELQSQVQESLRRAVKASGSVS